MSEAKIAAVICVLLTNVVALPAPLKFTVAPDTKPTPFTVSVNAAEPATALEGEIELTIDGNRYCAKAGDSFHFRSELPHAYRNIGTKPARVLWVNTPPTF